jgi:hypothetical protein
MPLLPKRHSSFVFSHFTTTFGGLLRSHLATVFTLTPASCASRSCVHFKFNRISRKVTIIPCYTPFPPDNLTGQIVRFQTVPIDVYLNQKQASILSSVITSSHQCTSITLPAAVFPALELSCRFLLLPVPNMDDYPETIRTLRKGIQ